VLKLQTGNVSSKHFQAGQTMTASQLEKDKNLILSAMKKFTILEKQAGL